MMSRHIEDLLCCRCFNKAVTAEDEFNLCFIHLFCGEQLMRQSCSEKGTHFGELDIGSSIMEINKQLENTSAWKHIMGGDVKVDIYRSAKKCPHGLSSCLWPHSGDGNVYVPYVLMSNFDQNEQLLLRIALDEFGFLTCVKFKRRVFERDYIGIVSESGYYLAKSSRPTIVPKRNPNIPIGFAEGLSEIDVLKINKLYQCKTCGNLLTQNDRSFTSPNFPAVYPNNVRCKWMIRAPAAMKIVLEFDYFNIRPFIACLRDHLSVFEGSNSDLRVIRRRSCGKLAPAAISSEFKILLAFFTDDSKQAKGFSAKYRFIHCATTLMTSARNYKGKIDYRGPGSSFEQSNCIWLIQAHWGHKILLRVTAHNLQESDQCAKAFLLIRDVAEGPPVFKAKICKTTMAFVVDGKALMVEFYHPGAPNHPGFTAQYAAVHNAGEGSFQWSQCNLCMLILCRVLISS
ncbi:hypothetical protein chiPu_0020278 [Chiloscyllium punctatum]|uniref:CUB domain-containing protein n=1 Tax=Chiloscyllium punctatum TaxID=137246 RepID=A0A401RUJ6_CHIPU|nr:hypothetical protein [Chiloscyllium punctatum]